MLAAEANKTKLLISTAHHKLADELLAEKFPHAHQFHVISKAHESATTVHIEIELTSREAARPIAIWLCDRVKKHGAHGTKIEGRICPERVDDVVLLITEKIAATDQERTPIENPDNDMSANPLNFGDKKE